MTSTLLHGNEHDLTDKNEKAQNPDLATNVLPFDFRYGRIFMHGIHTKLDGKNKLVFVSNMRRLGNSNNQMDKSHYNLNLFEGKINFLTGALTEIKQIHYYTTTSALSPARMRDGFSFSYQSTTEDARAWEVQVTRSNYQWLSGVGYGINGQEALHLQTLANTTTVKGDWLVTGYYYNQNNNGFGKILANPTDNLAQNVEGIRIIDAQPVLLPEQVEVIDMVPAVPINDVISSVGKFAAPRAGRVNEIFASYSPHTSNDKDFFNGTKSHYDSHMSAFPMSAIVSILTQIGRSLS